MERALLYSLMVYAVVSVSIRLIQRFDDSSWKITGMGKYILPGISGINGILLWEISVLGKMRITEKEMIFLSLFAGCLLFACLTDFRKCIVFQFTWWMAAAVLGMWFIEKNIWNGWTNGTIKPDLQVLTGMCELILYILLQEFIFARMYGRADCHAFGTCAIAGYLCGINMKGYVYHMAIAFGMLGCVQLIRGNVNCKGNLKQSVAFLPYITFGFWVWLYIAFFPK